MKKVTIWEKLNYYLFNQMSDSPGFRLWLQKARDKKADAQAHMTSISIQNASKTYNDGK